jgi:hypothetical protein
MLAGDEAAFRLLTRFAGAASERNDTGTISVTARLKIDAVRSALDP